MGSKQHICSATLVFATVFCVGSALAEAPTPEQALGYMPIQQQFDFDKPSKDEIKQCTIKPEKEGNSTAWLVRDKQGKLLRRFADTNGDNVVDLWCYFLDGLEVYRDIDSDFNRKADQYRWFNSAGTRVGIDKNEDGKVDAWRNISPQEVAEQLVIAIQTGDQTRFELLLPTAGEIAELGLGKLRSEALAASTKAAASGFKKYATVQKAVTAKSRYMDFGSSRPATIPAGTDGSTKDLTVYENCSALVQADGKNDQLYLGTLVAIGNTWKLIALPTSGSENQPLAGSGSFLQTGQSQEGDGVAANPGAPSEEMQKLMAELERLDREADGLAADKLAVNIEERAKLLRRLSEISPDPEMREQWFRQLADMIAAAIQSGSFPQGLELLSELQKQLTEASAAESLLSHVEFQRMWGEYVTSQQQTGPEASKAQEKWLADLQAFVGKHPKSIDSAEALLQLGMYNEFVGKSEEGLKWYQQLAADFPSVAQSNKARGAITRLASAGKPMRLKGQDLLAAGEVDLAKYKGKVVLIHYWATWCEPCKADMVMIKDFYAKNKNRNFEVIGVCLDDQPAGAKQFLTENIYPWKHLNEKGGLDGRLANEMGVMTLPLMILVDQKGNVVKDNIHVAELDAELNALAQPLNAGGNANRPKAAPR